MSTASDRPIRTPSGAQPPADFRLEGRLVQPALNRISSARETVQLEPKIMQVLLALAARPGYVVTRERLFLDVWEGAYVTEDVLTRAVGELRRIFGDDSGRPRVIETIRKTGYRLLAAPEPVESPAQRAEPSAPARRRLELRAPDRRFWIAAAIILASVLGWRLWPRAVRPSAPMRIHLLSGAAGNERDPAVSPDGTRVAFAWNGGTGDLMSLYVQLVDGDRPLRLTSSADGDDRAPAWSGDGTRLAFTREQGGDCRVLSVPALGGVEKPLGPCGDRDHRRLAWSPDGRWIAVTRREGASPLRIELLSPETLERRVVTRPPDGILGDTSPAFSPDGRTLVFTRNLTEGVTDLYRTSLGGGAGEATRLTFDDRDTMGSDWSADGRSIVFSSSRAGMYSLWRVPTGGGEPAFIAGGGMKMKHPSTARSRNVVAYENWLYQVDLWRVSLDGGPASGALTPSTDEWSYQPHLSPDGSRVAFVSTRSGEQDVWVAGASGEEPRRITSLSNARVETPRWSPDGTRILFSARQGGRADLWTVEAAGGVARRVTSGPGDALAPSWSRDGRSVYFASRPAGGGRWSVRRLFFADGASVAVADGGYAAKESPDGTTLFFTRAEEPGIWSQPVAGGAPVRVVPGVAPEDWADWEVGDRGIYFKVVSGSPPLASLAFLPSGAAVPVVLAPLPDPGWSGLSVSRDGRFAVYSRVDRHACDIRLIDNPS